MKGNTLLLVNPVSGKGYGRKKLFDIVERLTCGGCRVTVMPTLPAGATEKLIAAEGGNYELIIAAGGDGTLNHVASGIVGSGLTTALGYIPLGSTNDFAASLGIPSKLSDACDRILERDPAPIDIGVFGDRRFVYIACTGIFADTSYETPQQVKNLLGHNAYILHSVASLTANNRTRCRVDADGEIIEGEFILISVSNSLRAGGVFKLPDGYVSFDDGIFELILVPAPKNIIASTTMLNKIITKSVTDDPFIHRKVSRARFEFESGQAWTLDGEYGGTVTSIDIGVDKRSLNFIR